MPIFHYKTDTFPVNKPFPCVSQGNCCSLIIHNCHREYNNTRAVTDTGYSCLKLSGGSGLVYNYFYCWSWAYLTNMKLCLKTHGSRWQIVWHQTCRLFGTRLAPPAVGSKWILLRLAGNWLEREEWGLPPRQILPFQTEIGGNIVGNNFDQHICLLGGWNKVI